MPVTAKQYAKLHSQSSLHEAFGHTIKVALFTNVLVPSQTNDTLFTSAPYTSNQVANGNGYTTGGVALTSVTLATTALITTLDSVDPSWTVTGAGFTYRYAVFYDTTTNVVISYVDFGTDIVAVAGTHSIVLDANGITRVTVS